MEILDILKHSAEELYPEDLEFFETELATGTYDEVYIATCKEQINLLKKWMLASKTQKQESDKQKDSPMIPLNKTLSSARNMSKEELFFQEVRIMRESTNYKSQFKEYIQMSDVDSAFVDKHYAFFQPWEMDAIVSVKPMKEEFLEKYFGAIDKEKIARYQCFSEQFFMKHFSQMDANLVLSKGKNAWRKRENRSKQLDVFLRLKGVKI